MALTPNFTAGSIIGSPQSVYLTDTSTGSDVTIVSRRVYIQTEQGVYLVPSGTTTDYTVWSISDSTISIDCLTKDQAPFIKVDWLNISGVVVQTKTQLCLFRLFGLQKSFSLTGSLVGNPSLITDTNWWDNKLKLRVNLDDAYEAVTIGGNIYDAQAALDRSTYMVNNSSIFF